MSDWRTLDPRTVRASGAVALGVCVAAGVPTLVGIASGSRSLALPAVIVAAATVLITVAVVVAERVRLSRTRFRVGDDRVELHTGIVVRARRSLTRERIRSVEVTADPVARVLGLATLRMGTGQQASATEHPLELRALRRDDAEALRAELLRRAAPTTSTGGEIATFDPRWTAYAPLSFLTPALGTAAAGLVLQVAQWFGLENTVIDTVIATARTLGPWWSVAVGAVAVLVIGSVASLALFAEAWWGHRLEREPSGTLRVHRGLLTRRSTTLEERRLRGVAVVEPLGVRTVGAARVDAVATGLRSAGSGGSNAEQRSDPSGLLPAAPRALAERIAAEVLREPVSPTRAAVLRPHPPAARARRVRWATAAALVPALVLAVLGVTVHGGFGVAAAIAAVIAVPVGIALGREGYRKLGHGLSGAYLVTREGMTRRRTVALQRAGVIGWSVRQSFLQRRVGLATLRFTTAAGEQAYAVRDMAACEAAAFAREALGDVVTPFLADDRDRRAPAVAT